MALHRLGISFITSTVWSFETSKRHRIAYFAVAVVYFTSKASFPHVSNRDSSRISGPGTRPANQKRKTEAHEYLSGGPCTSLMNPSLSRSHYCPFKNKKANCVRTAYYIRPIGLADCQGRDGARDYIFFFLIAQIANSAIVVITPVTMVVPPSHRSRLWWRIWLSQCTNFTVTFQLIGTGNVVLVVVVFININ